MRSHRDLSFAEGRRILFLAFSCLLLSFPGCARKNEPAQPQESLGGAPARKLDACDLLKADEITAIQGSPIKETKSSAFSNGKFRVSQCFYEALEPGKSINLAVTSSDPDSSAKISPGAFWKEKFAPYRGGATEREETRAEGEKEERLPPKRIERLGDDAYWMGRDALYVLKGDVYVRLSIGGADSVETKIEKARTLMAHVLGRLSTPTPKP